MAWSTWARHTSMSCSSPSSSRSTPASCRAVRAAPAWRAGWAGTTVVRYWRPQRHRADPAARHASLSTPTMPVGPSYASAQPQAADSSGSVAVPVTRTGAGVGDVAEECAEGDDHRASGLWRRDDRAAVLLPADVGLDAAQHHEVAFGERHRVVVVRGPRDRPRDTVDELDLRSPRLVVDVLVGVDAREANRERATMSQSAAPVAASPASFQPSNAATSNGREARLSFPHESAVHRGSLRPAFIGPVSSSAMGISTPDEYRSSTRRRPPALLPRSPHRRHPGGARAAASPSTTPRIDYELAEDPPHRDLAVATDPDTGEEFSAYYTCPARREDLLAPLAASSRPCTALGGTMVTLIKEIGSDALFALLRVLDGEALERAHGVLRALPRRGPRRRRGPDRREGRPVAGARTSRPTPTCTCASSRSAPTASSCAAPSATPRSAPTPTRSSCCPTRAMGPDDADYAVAFAVPAQRARACRCTSRPTAPATTTRSSSRCRRKHKMLETLTVFDDVFVPWERVFLCREPELAGPLALSFVEYHRFTAVSYKLPLLDAARRRAALDRRDERRGQGRPHPRQADPAHHLRRDGPGPHRDGRRCGPAIDERGIAYPDPMTTNLAKYTFATRLPPGPRAGAGLRRRPAGDRARAARTGPTPRSAPCSRSTSSAAAPAEERLRLMNLISDLTARDFGGYHAVLAVHAEGSIEAEKMQILRAYDPAARLASTPAGWRPSTRASGDAGSAGLDGRAVALGVAGDAPHGHVDVVPGGGALLFGFATPEAVLAVLTCPLTARRGARRSWCRRRGPWPHGRCGSPVAHQRERRRGRSDPGRQRCPSRSAGR